MGITLGDAILHLKTDDSQLQSGLQGATGGITSWLGGIQGAITTGLVGAMVGGVMQGIRAAAEEQTAFMKLEAVYRATGGAIGMTVDQLKQLAEQLMFTTGIEHEQFIEAEALAMTYGNISGEVMPRLLAVAADMAALFDGDVVSSTRNVAIALSAGEDGLMRLRRAGVIFTDEQKEMIATMMAAGDAMGAQNIILTELEGRFGGTAAAALDTFNGRMAALKTSVGELWEGLGNLNIGGRTLVEWMTDGITTATSLLTISGQIDTAFESTRDEIARSATTYDDYFEAQLGIAENAGKITALNAMLIRSLREGSGATDLDAVSIRGLWQELENLGIITSEAAWSEMQLGVEASTAAASVAPLAAELRPLSDEYFNNRVAADAAAAGTERANAAWEYANALPGTITRQMYITILTMLQQQAWFGVEHGGDQTPGVTDTSRNWGAYAEQGTEASEPGVWTAENANELSRLRYLASVGRPGRGQRGLSFDVEGPSGTDQVPVNLALSRGEHVEVTPAGEAGGKQVTIQIGPNYINNRDDLQALENDVMQIFRGV